MGHAVITFRQDAAIRVENDGTEAGSTLGTTNTAYTRTVDEKFRHRFVIQEVGGAASSNFEEHIEFSKNGGAWTAPDGLGGGTEAVKVVGSAFYVDGEDTTQRVGSGTFLGTNSGMTDESDTGSGTEPDFAGSDEFECEFCLQIQANNVSNGDTIRLRIIDTVIDPLDQYNAASLFDITVDKPAPPVTRRIFVVS